MERSINLDEISDGRLYDLNDMARADCGSCEGCSACCSGMGASVVLDPWDICQLTVGLGLTFQQLMADRLELNMVDRIILPNLKMAGERERCPFLNPQERCAIHAIRPGFCRLFPLGRLYEGRSFRYFLQVHECGKADRSKVKIRKWLDTPQLREHERFVADWHYFLKDMERGMKGDEGRMRTVDMYILNHFFAAPYDPGEGFYGQFGRRLAEAGLFAEGQGITLGTVDDR